MLKNLFAMLIVGLVCLTGCDDEDKEKPAKVIKREFQCGAIVGDKYMPFKNKLGQPYKWDTSQAMRINFDPKVPEFVAKATMDAFEKWSKHVGNQFKIERTAVSPNIQVRWEDDIKNIFNPGFIAWAGFSSRDALTISGGHITYNAVNYTFHSGAPLGVGPSNPATGKRDVEIEGVALHEVGHALGLDHSMVLGPKMDPATMHPTIHNASSTLHLDDIAGIRNTYDGGGNTDPLPAAMFELDKTMLLYKQIGFPFEYRDSQTMVRPAELKGKIVHQIITGKITLVYSVESREYLGSIIGNKFQKR